MQMFYKSLTTFYAIIFVCVLLVGGLSARQHNKFNLQHFFGNKYTKSGRPIENEMVQLDGTKYSLVQTMQTTTGSTTDSSLASSSSSSSDSSSTIGNDLGNFKVQQPSDTSSDPIQSLQDAQQTANEGSYSSTSTNADSALISSLLAQQQAEAAAATTTTTTTTAATTSATQAAGQNAVVAEAQPTYAAPAATTTAATAATAAATTVSVQTITVEVSVIEEGITQDNFLFGPINAGDTNTNEYLSVAIVFGLFVLVFLLILIRRAIEKYLNEILIARLNSIMKDIIVIITALTFVLFLDYHNVFYWRLNVSTMCLLVLVFALFWFTLSTVLVLIGQAFCVKWEDYETIVPKRESILAEYKRLHSKKVNKEKMTRAERGDLDKYHHQLEYILIRQEFIAPTFLPTISEAFLRDDFNFAEYLAHSLERTLRDIFNLSVLSLVVVIINVAIWAVIDDHVSLTWDTAIVFVLIIFLFVALVLISRKFGNIKSALVADVSTLLHLPTVFANFTPFRRDPLACAETRSDVPDFISFEKPPPKQRRLLKSQMAANRHERLFWFGAPKFCIRLIHCLFLTHVLWTVIFVSDYLDEYEILGKILIGIAIGLFLLVDTFYLIPRLTRQYVIISNIQMRRDYGLIEKVIFKQRNQTRTALAKFYRLIKSSRKEILKENNSAPKLKPFLEKQLVDAFRIINNDESKVINLHELKKIIHLCGKEVKRDELVYLAREATKDDYQQIHFDDLVRAIEFLSQDVKLEPYATTKDVLKSLSEEDGLITLKELAKIIVEHKVLNKQEISNLLHEFKYLSIDGQEVEIDHVAAYVRHNLECLPR